MTEKTDRYRETLFLPQTAFPMKAGLPEKEPALLKRWQEMGLYERLRRESKGRPLYVLHDGPPYANANLHIGHALNKILKDIVTRSRQMAGYDSNYVPGWDCHGLPIEWKIEEEYRAKGRNKDAVPVNDFRRECRSFAEHWVGVQREEFERLGVTGDFKNPYLTMAFEAEALIAKELMKFSESGQLYRGSKPVMWSVVEKTALAEAEIEYQDYTSDQIWVKFPVKTPGPHAAYGPGTVHRQLAELWQASVVIWTTTPWTIPGNRAISYSNKIMYGLYEITAVDSGSLLEVGEKLIISDELATEVLKIAKAKADRKFYVSGAFFRGKGMKCSHPLQASGYTFDVILLEGDHVYDDVGTGWVHTAPGHGLDDYEVWKRYEAELRRDNTDTQIPHTVDADGFFTKEAPGFEGKRVIDENGEKGDANEAVIAALKDAGMLVARGKLKHQYPHSWRSKKPIIFRNTPQWFIAMDQGTPTLREKSLKAIAETKFFPPTGQNRLRGMIEAKPDWVVSRQRAWGVPITVFVHKQTNEILKHSNVNARIVEVFAKEGADAWFADGARERFLGPDVNDPENWEQVKDILDVWFDSGSTHAFCLEQRPDLKWPADLYLEGSDQHRGWFHSSLIESCGTRGRAPYDAVLTHGFVMAEDGRKMSKSEGNVVTPQEVIAKSGADILRLWVASSDYGEDLRLGPEILKQNMEAYRKLRNTLRYILGGVEGLKDWEQVYAPDMPELERYILHLLHELGHEVMKAYEVFDYRRIYGLLTNFMNVDLSAFYFDIRKDALYCDPLSALRRKACRTVLDQLFHCLTTWWAPILAFTMEEVWLCRFPHEQSSVHVMAFAKPPPDWHAPDIAAKWTVIRNVRRAVTGALELERAQKRIGSSLEAAPKIYVRMDEAGLAAVKGVDWAEICITSAATLEEGDGPAEAFRLDDLNNVAVVPARAEGRKCARSWKISPLVGSDPDFPDISPRDAEAVREWQTRHKRTV